MAKEEKDTDKAESADAASNDDVSAGGWTDKQKVKRKDFAGPRSASEALRIAMTRQAYAEITAHAKDSLDKEICGVMLGDFCEDDTGAHVVVDGVIRAVAAKKGATHVTFTQDTWSQIHEKKDKDFPRKQIVGWYHSHPGFGVEFSEMDRFIQKNFFAGPSQFAYVTDPLGGKEAILANADGKMVSLARFWVDGREKHCTVAAAEEEKEDGRDGAEGAAGGAAVAAAPKLLKQIEALQDRVTQMMRDMEARNDSLQRWLVNIALFIATVVVGYVMWQVIAAYWKPPEHPSMVQEENVPIRVMTNDGPRDVVLRLQVSGWEIPPEVRTDIAMFVEKEHQRLLEEAKKAAEAASRPASQPAAPSATEPSTGK